MQTFVMYKSHPRTMSVLDMPRLGKQRAETRQILESLRGESGGWSHHPAVQMWEGYEPALVLYGLFVCHEWRIVRGLNDNTWGYFAKMAAEYGIAGVEPIPTGQDVENPPWLDDTWVLRSHRSNLVRKAPHIYDEWFPATPEDMPYLWPVIDRKAPGGYYLTVSAADLPRLQSGERLLPDGLAVDLETRKVTIQ